MTLPRTLFLMSLALLVSSCEFWDSSYVSSPENVRARLGNVLPPEAAGVTGLYANADVDCLLARYCVNTGDVAATVEAMHQRAAADGWNVVSRTARSVEYHRADMSAKGYEIIRVKTGGRCAYVAWLQADGPVTADEFYRSGEMDWAKDEFWPRLAAAAAADGAELRVPQ